MIDWISCVIPCSHNPPIDNGQVIKLSPDGTVEWVSKKRLSVIGSHDAGITIRSTTPITGLDAITSHNVYRHSHLEISGNPVKFLQGHNLWGTDDLPNLILDLIDKLVSRQELKLTPTDEDKQAWLNGQIRLTRVDVTRSYSLPSRSDVLAWIRAAEFSGRVRKGRGELKGTTLYFNKQSSYWSMKFYSKGQELEAKGHRQEAIHHLPSARAWADTILRSELTIRSKQLKHQGLSAVTAWLPLDGLDGVVFDSQELLTHQLENMTMTIQSDLPEQVFDKLTNQQKLAYNVWKNGNDLRPIISKAAFYKLRTKLLSHDIDIAIVQPKEVSNVVPLIRVLEAIPVGVPEWAIGTDLYYEPTKRKFAVHG